MNDDKKQSFREKQTVQKFKNLNVMRGKFITTSLKLAVLAGSRSKQMIVKETNADLSEFEIIWTKKNEVKAPLVKNMKLEDRMAAAV